MFGTRAFSEAPADHSLLGAMISAYFLSGKEKHE